MPKLTLSVDKAVILRAKRYARRRGVSVSKLVETYLDMVSEPPKVKEGPPILRSLRGTLKRGDQDDYRRYVAAKYQ